MEHFYGRPVGPLTLPEFMGALNSIGATREHLRPKTAEEILAAQNDAMAKAQAIALKAKLELRARRGE